MTQNIEGNMTYSLLWFE